LNRFSAALGLRSTSEKQMSEPLAQKLRDQFATTIEANDIAAANADLRVSEDRDHFTNGYPLFRACQRNHESLAALLLFHNAHPDAPGSDPDDQPELGMPLHFAAIDHRNYRLANVLLDHGATPTGHPNCDQSTIERMYCLAREGGMSDSLVRRAYARFLSDRSTLELRSLTDLVGHDATEPIQLFARMVDLGGQPPFCAIVRDGFDDLLMEIVESSPTEDGPTLDYPNSNVLGNISGAARWYGYPKLVRRLMEQPSFCYDYESSISTIGVAIGSHNRDGDYSEYREIIIMQLESLKSHGDLENAQADSSFQPLFHMATDFTWHNNYGYRAEIATPECYVDLAELFVSWGLGDINYCDPKTGHSPLSASVNRGHHPGIATYIQWLLDHGADLRESERDELNPIAIATDKGLDGIRRLLQNSIKS
jgi:hypothetical protein